MAALIDSSVLIAGERGDLDLDRFVAQHGQTDLALASILTPDHQRQVEGARAGLIHMVGVGGVCVVHILKRS